MKLKYVDDLSGGRKRFRRRWPKAVAEVLGEIFFQVSMKARKGAALVFEQEALQSQFDSMVATVTQDAEQLARLSLRERWRQAVAEADRLLEGSRGRDEDEIRQIVADDIAQRQGDPMLYRAVVTPDAPPPRHTLSDAWSLYAQERLTGTEGRNGFNRLERVRKRVEGALGSLSGLVMSDLKREHGRALRDFMLKQKASTGKLLSIGTIRRELNTVRAIAEMALLEFDLHSTVSNPFKKLEIKRAGDNAPTIARENRDPLPEAVLKVMRERIENKVQIRELALIWYMLEGTGCRGAEVVGLRVEDVRLDHPTPHINIQWHPDRRVKTTTSHRLVPLIGPALDAAKEAVKLAGDNRLLFPRYVGENGVEAVSASLNKHLLALTKNPKHVVYSLRHNLKAKLVAAGTEARIEHRILGHAEGGVGDRVYGNEEAWLKVCAEAIRKALG